MSPFVFRAGAQQKEHFVQLFAIKNKQNKWNIKQYVYIVFVSAL